MTARRLSSSSSLVTGVVMALFLGCSGGGRENQGEGLDLGDGSVSDGGDGGNYGDGRVSILLIAPADPVLATTGADATIQLTATLDGLPVQDVSWSADNSRLGYIDSMGVFHANGLVAGTTTITASFNGKVATTVLRVTTNFERVEDGVTPEQRTALDTTPPLANDNFKWLYPYDKTVFPRGMPGPFMQFAGGAADATRITVTVGDFSFQGYFTAKNPASIQLPSDVWEALTNSSDGTTQVTVQVLKLVGSSVVGPTSQTWRIAPGDLKGIIYYNTYNYSAPETPNKKQGAVMRIRPGQQAEMMISNYECTVCHSVSANGNVLAAGVQWDDGFYKNGNDEDVIARPAGSIPDPANLPDELEGNPNASASFDLREDGTSPVLNQDLEGRTFPFAGLTPDGKYLVTNAIPASGSYVRGLSGVFPSKLVESATGLTVDAPTLTTQVTNAITPTFSPDGKRLAFSSADGTDAARKLKTMTVDLSTMPPTFGAPTVVAEYVGLSRTADNDPPGILGWPSFLPDGLGIVFHEGDRFDTATWGGGESYAEIFLADTTTGTVNHLAALNGWLDATTSALPHGAMEENHRNYEPTVLPVPVGGYYWVIFTSRRAYGHTLAPGGTMPGTGNEWGYVQNGQEHPSARKKLWVAAIDLDYSGKVDPSHPAFYLEGQELDAGNMRAFSALEPCKQEGDTCTSGAECCEGFCRQIVPTGEFGEIQYTCVPPVAGCSNVDEACVTDADCCGYDDGEKCINSRCALPFIDLQ